MESRITITRKSPEDAQNRQVIVTLNGEDFATLMYGKSASGAVKPGQYTLQVNNTWKKKSIHFNVAPGEHVKFRTINHAARGTGFFGALISALPMDVSIERED